MHQWLKNILISLLTWEAKYLLRRRKPFVIAVTGSVGKTTTKDAIYHVLKEQAPSRKSQKSFNSEIGIPLTILGLDNAWRSPVLWLWNILRGFLLLLFPFGYPKLLVLEIGADHPGDIARVTKWLQPNIAVVTRLPDRPVHVEYFASPLDVKKEKGELVRALAPHGVFVANADDDAVLLLRENTAERMFTFGFNEGAQVRGSFPQVKYEKKGDRALPVGMILHIDWQGNSIPVVLHDVLGVQPAFAALAAFAVGVLREESPLAIAEALRTLEAPPGRMHIISGQNESVIIDDSYNSSPVAAEAALLTLQMLEGGRKIAMLGDMLELGEYAEEEHRRIGRIAADVVDELVLVGTRAAWIASAAKEAGLSEKQIHQFANSLDAGKWLLPLLAPGDLILVKGSQGSGINMIRMERAVKVLMAHPEDAPRMLVRQEKEWLRQYSS